MDTRVAIPSRGWRIGQEITFVNCYGKNPVTGTVVDRPGPYSVNVKVGGKLNFVPTSLITAPPPTNENT